MLHSAWVWIRVWMVWAGEDWPDRLLDLPIHWILFFLRTEGLHAVTRHTCGVDPQHAGTIAVTTICTWILHSSTLTIRSWELGSKLYCLYCQCTYVVYILNDTLTLAHTTCFLICNHISPNKLVWLVRPENAFIQTNSRLYNIPSLQCVHMDSDTEWVQRELPLPQCSLGWGQRGSSTPD